MWDDGQLGEVEWHVFTAQETKTAPRIIEEDAESIGTSLLFKHGIVRDRTNELEFDADDFEGD